jgi:hypothetical protein
MNAAAEAEGCGVKFLRWKVGAHLVGLAAELGGAIHRLQDWSSPRRRWLRQALALMVLAGCCLTDRLLDAGELLLED